MKKILRWVIFQIFGKRKLHHLNDRQKAILASMMKGNQGVMLDRNNSDVRELVRYGILREGNEEE